MTEVDVRGFSCPIPVVKTKKAMEEHPKDTLSVLIADSTAKENVTRLGESRGYQVDVKEADGEWQVTLTPPAK